MIYLKIAILILFSSALWASPLPCSKWEVLVRAHEVQAYQRKDGTAVRKSDKGVHCRLKFPKVEGWQERFTDKMPIGWPLENEKFKIWTQLEKEIVLKWMSEQPNALKNLKGITFLRGSLSAVNSKNPGAAIKRLNVIALYDEFFKANNKSAILSHELSHLYLYDLGSNPKMDLFIASTGWRLSPNRDYERDPKIPLLLPDSAFDIYEDLANHLEFYLHHPEILKRKNPAAYQKLSDIVGPDFKLEK